MNRVKLNEEEIKELLSIRATIVKEKQRCRELGILYLDPQETFELINKLLTDYDKEEKDKKGDKCE